MITSKTLLREYFQADMKANGKKNFSLFKSLLGAEKILFFIYLLRQCEYAKNTKKGWFKIVYWYFKRISLRLGFSIPLNVFDRGLSIPHYGTIIVNARAKVGRNCRLHCCVNIGASAGNPLAPQIGDNVYIGPSAVIFGGITIASNTTIAANATVNKTSLQENAVLAGSPAKVIKENFPVWWENNELSLS